MDIAFGAQEERAQRDRALAADYAQTVAACMTSNGFEYWPQEFQNSDVEPALPDSAEFRRQYGYGIVNRPELSPSDVPATDRNAEYRSSLSRGAQAAYDVALYGRNTEGESVTPAQRGCFDQAWDDVYSQVMAIDRTWSGLLDDMNAMQARIQETPDMEMVLNDWSDCMADSGIDGVSSPDDAQEGIEHALAETQTQEGGGLVVTDKTKLIALGNQEIQIATADIQCREEVDYGARYDAIRIEHENEFVTTHRSDLEAWALAWSQQ